jgi:hypothetical protein
VASQGGDIHIRPLFHFGNGRLLDAQGFGKHFLGEAPGVPQFIKGKLFEGFLYRLVNALRDSGLIFFPTLKVYGSFFYPCQSKRVYADTFCSTLKREVETLEGKHAATEVRQSVFMYVEAYYNRLRLHSALDYVVPDVFNSGQVA